MANIASSVCRCQYLLDRVGEIHVIPVVPVNRCRFLPPSPGSSLCSLDLGDLHCHGSGHWAVTANLISRISDVRMNLASSRFCEVVLLQLKTEAASCLHIDWFSLVLSVQSSLCGSCCFRGTININMKLYILMYIVRLLQILKYC